MRRLMTLFLVMFTSAAIAQDLPAAKKTLHRLTSRKLWGRGYTKNGMAKAADYLSTQFKEIGLQPMKGNSFRQNFSYPANTFPGKMEVAVNGKKLIPGKDFIVEPASSGQKNKGVQEVQTDSVTYISKAKRLIITMQNKLTWSVAQKAEDYTLLQINKKSLSEKPQTVDVNIENVFVPEFKTSNICGIVKGTKHPDSMLLITGHYDHLGGMGAKTYFPGANDNASGITLLLTLAKYYASHPQPYSIGFICFAGEEAGLLGSAEFIRHPLIPLDRIRFLINVDMVGTGEKGITVVNATLHKKEFNLLKKLNDQHQYLPKINSRGKAANSDHYYFTEKGVPAFFIYTEGGIRAYHDIYDVEATLPLTKFKDLYHLFIDFNSALMK
ncbi:M28 family metallopeptidase [Pedobacter sp. L105]|uniref:M28 family metallopeptidase n=1 Tax=Pedobacter sp. L105 TaxID=1641871 RepID=UPI00131B56E9|nr:M28 family peptidase [Pedobacter sp. L105]